MLVFLKKRIQSFVFAGQGLGYLFKTQHNAQIHALMTILAILAGFIFKLSSLEWCMVCLSIGLVIAVEGFNTALESLTDLVSPEYHHLAKITKDVASGAVLITALTAFVIGFIIFLPKVIGVLAY